MLSGAFSVASRDAVALVFLLAGFMKMRNPAVVVNAIHDVFPTLYRRRVPIRGRAFGLLEVGVAALLIAGTGFWSTVPAWVLLVAFSLFLALARRRAPNSGCGCLGDLTRGGHEAALLRNLLLAGALVCAIVGSGPRLGIGVLSTAVELAILVALVPEGFFMLRSLASEGRPT